MILATYWPGTPLRLLVAAEGAGACSRCGLGGRWRFALTGPGEPMARRLLTLEPSRPWRWHSFWWTPDSPNYRVRALTFRLRTPTGEGEARVRYLGRGAALAELVSAQLVAGSLPTGGRAGAETWLTLTVANTGTSPWSSGAPLPVLWGYRLYDADGVLAGEGRARLPREIVPGEELTQELAIGWPQQPGSYRLEVDLVRRISPGSRRRRRAAPGRRGEITPARP